MAYGVQHVLTILGSFFFHFVVFKWLAAPVLRRLWPVFETLPTSKQVSTRNCAMGVIHSSIVGGLACYTYLFSNATSLPPDKLWHDCPFVRFTNCILLGYTLVDLMLIACYSSLRDRQMAFHHVFTAWATYVASVDPVIPYHAVLAVMTEMSSPFVNFRVILLNLGQKSSFLYKVNGVAMMVVFFFCRIITIPPTWYHVAGHFSRDELYGIGLGVHVCLFVVTPLIHLLNVFWFSKICRGVYRVLLRAKAE